MAARYLTVEERAELEHRTPGSIWTERARGDGPPAVKCGRRILFPEDDWMAWMKSKQEPPRATARSPHQDRAVTLTTNAAPAKKRGSLAS